MSTSTSTAGREALVPYDAAAARYDVVIGLEVHVELGTATKMFDGSSTVFGADANTQVSPVSLGLPGALPVVNRLAVEHGMRIGLALGCEIAQMCRFARKNYFYPDMPKNFQTSQYDEPLAADGHLDVVLEDGTPWRVEVERAHLEEDTGKSTHVGGATGRIHGADHSLVDYNRAGIPLVEIVTRPVTGAGARAPEVARAYVAALRDLLRALGVSEARMEQGQMRADVNVSLRPSPDAPLGTRTETKNVNSFRSVERAVRFEVQRQAAVLDGGGRVFQETRHWHEDTGVTTSGRPKSDADDYRYFPEPDLVPLTPSREWVEQVRATLPEMPVARRARLQAEWGYSDLEMRDVVNAGLLDVLVATVAEGASAAAARKWWGGELARTANDRGVEVTDLPVGPVEVAGLARLVDDGRITDRMAREVLAGVLAGEGTPEEVVTARGLEVVSDESALVSAVDEALAAQPDVAEKIRGGKVAAAGAVVGAVMKATRGAADARRVRELVLERVGATAS